MPEIADPKTTEVKSSEAKTTPVCAFLLADHLDAALAAGEDLLSASSETSECEPEACGRRIADARAGQRHLVERIRGLELALISRCLRARERAHELAARDPRFKQVTGLFIGGTAPLVDAIADCSDATAHDFETGDGILAYLRAHGLVSEDTETLDERAGIRVGEDFLIARRITLGVLLDLVAAFLDALELHFDLYEIDIEPADETTAALAAPAEAA